MGGDKNLENLGVAVACVMLKLDVSLEMWLHGKQRNIARCVTNGAPEIQKRVALAKEANERHHRRRLAALLAFTRGDNVRGMALGDVTNDSVLVRDAAPDCFGAADFGDSGRAASTRVHTMPRLRRTASGSDGFDFALLDDGTRAGGILSNGGAGEDV